MPVSLQEGHESVARAEPVTIRCHWNPDPALVLKCQQRAAPENRFWKGRAIGDIIDLYPWADLKREALAQAKEFARNMRNQKQAYDLIGEPGGMLLYGPYMEKVDWRKAQEVRTVRGAGNRKLWDYSPGFLYGRDEWDFSKGVAMFIVGTFLAKFGSLSTDGRRVIV